MFQEIQRLRDKERELAEEVRLKEARNERMRVSASVDTFYELLDQNCPCIHLDRWIAWRGM
jgi:hypothetical protein